MRLRPSYCVVPDYPGLEDQAPVSGHLMGAFQGRLAVLPASSAQVARVDRLMHQAHLCRQCQACLWWEMLAWPYQNGLQEPDRAISPSLSLSPIMFL